MNIGSKEDNDLSLGVTALQMQGQIIPAGFGGHLAKASIAVSEKVQAVSLTHLRGRGGENYILTNTCVRAVEQVVNALWLAVRVSGFLSLHLCYPSIISAKQAFTMKA